MAKAKERLLEWLRDAHAMEKQAEKMLDATAGRIENYPEIKQKLEQHLAETKRQAALIEGCIERHGESTSTLKDAAGKLTAIGQGLSGLFVGDEIVKASMASYTFEHMEISAYRALVAAAQEAGDAETARVCEGILKEEEAMADWLGTHLPDTTRKYLSREAADLTAKH